MAQSKVYYPGLDALRGIAIILIILYHYFYFFRIGWIGVDLFFVLSGFLITTTLLKSRNKTGYFRNFFLRRVLRIFPLYFFVLIVFFLTAPILFKQKQVGSVYAYYSDYQLWFWTLTENWLFIKKSIPPEPILQHFWSLAVEEQFYLVWPFLVYFLKNLRDIKYVFLGFFLMALLVRLWLWFNPTGHEAFYYNSFARADSLAAGAFLAAIHFEGKKISILQTWLALIGFVALVLSAIFISGSINHNSSSFATVGYSVSAIFFMCICYRMMQSTSLIANNTLLRYAGQISYGIYVYHIPVYLLVSYFITNRVHEFISNTKHAQAFVAIVSAVLTLLTASISYYILERPFLKMKTKFS